MAIETERKFLVNGDAYKAAAFRHTRVRQGYLSSVPERTVRIRIRDDKGLITIKGKGNASGASRYEWESEIPLQEAEQLLLLCEPGVIDKTRYEIQAGSLVFEVDEFHGDNEGLVMAELELPDEHTSFDRPAWLSEEVTGDPRYYNSMLQKHPYTKWQRH